LSRYNGIEVAEAEATCQRFVREMRCRSGAGRAGRRSGENVGGCLSAAETWRKRVGGFGDEGRGKSWGATVLPDAGA
jgi:hypothetical protein